MIVINRQAYLSNGTPGVILIHGVPFSVCIERPWLNNEPNVSCIPAGLYTLKWVDTQTAGNRNGRGLGVEGVPNRDLIRIHAGNTMDDLRGCIAPGLFYNMFGDKIGVGSSTATLHKLMDIMEGIKEMALLIKNPC